MPLMPHLRCRSGLDSKAALMYTASSSVRTPAQPGRSSFLGISERRVTVLLSEGRLVARKLGRDWVVLSLDYKRKRKPKTKKGGS